MTFMRPTRLALAATLVLFLGFVSPAQADTIVVAQVTWSLDVDGVDPTSCPDCDSLFTLEFLWHDGVGTLLDDPPPPVVSGSFSILVDGDWLTETEVEPFTFFDVDESSPIDQVPLSYFFGFPVIPAEAKAVLSFLDGVRFVDLGEKTLVLGQPVEFTWSFGDDGGHSVPESTSLALLTVSLLAMRYARRTR